jgi:hypothetical protein
LRQVRHAGHQSRDVELPAGRLNASWLLGF